jgi:hypothetical protein
MEQSLPRRPRYPSLHRIHKFRVIILPLLLIITFITLILAGIYAYCVAKPHTDIADQLAVDSTAEVDSSLFGKRETASETSAGLKTAPTTGDQSELALLFYTLTTPGVTIIYALFEIIIHHNTPKLLSLRKIYITLLASSSLLVCGWITTLSFWMHCELPAFNKDKAGQQVCPVQVRGHFMYGIHEDSIARIAMGWLIVLVYLGHIVLLASGYKVHKRIWRIIGSTKAEEDIEQKHGEARLVVVKFAEEERKPDDLGKEANVI